MVGAREVVRPHILNQQLDIGVPIVDVLLNGVTDMKRQHLLDMRIIRVHSESNGMNGRTGMATYQLQLQVL